MTNRQLNEDRPDPRAALAAWLRRDGLAEAQIDEIVARMEKMVVGSAVAEGDERAVRAAQAAISRFPTCVSIRSAKGIMVDVTGAGDLAQWEVEAAAGAVHQAAHPDAEILFDSFADEKMAGAVKVTVIAIDVE